MGEVTDAEPWYAVRCVLRTQGLVPLVRDELGPDDSLYEERITLWRATSFDEVVMRAEAEANEYAAANADAKRSTEYVGFAQSFHLFDEPSDGVEAFSLVRVSNLLPDEYLDRHFDTGRERQQTTWSDE